MTNHYQTVTMTAARDEVAGVWYIAESSLPGLAAEADTLDRLKERVCEIIPDLVDCDTDRDVATAAFFVHFTDALAEAARAMQAYPQPNYVITKVAEEAGEVVKAAVHCAEGRGTPEAVAAEMKQLIAMLYRLWIEGDELHGLKPISPRMRAANP